eukprot:2365487-Prorocentrum_lima.AAC.1
MLTRKRLYGGDAPMGMFGKPGWTQFETRPLGAHSAPRMPLSASRWLRKWPRKKVDSASRASTQI